MSLISKNNVGAAVLLLFIIVVSQVRLFDVLFHTALGRILLIAFILFLSYANKILGVVGVLFIIIMFNSSSGFGMMEGFEADGSLAKANAEAKVNGDGSKKMNADGSMMTNADGSKVNAAKMNADGSKKENADGTAKPLRQMAKTTAVAAEGFDILGTENNIRRGKQSNSIPVRKENNLDNDVFAYDSSSIFGSFSPF
jgi:hypothetical protein